MKWECGGVAYTVAGSIPAASTTQPVDFMAAEKPNGTNLGQLRRDGLQLTL